MPVDLGVFQRLQTLADYQQKEQEFQLQKQLISAKIHEAMNGRVESPAAVREYQFFNSLPDAEREKFLQVKRADQILNLGGVMGVRDPQGGGLSEQYAVTPRPQEMPGFQAQVAGAQAAAKGAVEATTAPAIAGAVARAKLDAGTSADAAKKTRQADSTLDILDQIESPDETGRNLLDYATGSTVGSLYAGGKKAFGVSDESTQANSQLEVYGRTLVNDVPRMEGPQSNFDLQSYMEQVGKIADPSVPADDKRAAIVAIRKLREKYASPRATKPALTKEQALRLAKERGLLNAR